jgi:hypothetical protein
MLVIMLMHNICMHYAVFRQCRMLSCPLQLGLVLHCLVWEFRHCAYWQ